MVQIKMTFQEHRASQIKADRYADGNLSEWGRFAMIALDPLPEHLIIVEDDEAIGEELYAKKIEAKIHKKTPKPVKPVAKAANGKRKTVGKKVAVKAKTKTIRRANGRTATRELRQ